MDAIVLWLVEETCNQEVVSSNSDVYAFDVIELSV